MKFISRNFICETSIYEVDFTHEDFTYVKFISRNFICETSIYEVDFTHEDFTYAKFSYMNSSNST